MRRLVPLTLCSFVFHLAMAGPAQADSVSKLDPAGDAPPRLDLTSVVYRNAAHLVSVRIQVPGLRRAGGVHLTIGPPTASDYAYVAKVSIRDDGSLRKRFVYSSSPGEAPAKCDFDATWKAAKNYIRIAVPHPCVDSISKENLYLRADMVSLVNTDRDYAPAAAHLARD
jgi:hypothetical protein